MKDFGHKVQLRDVAKDIDSQSRRPIDCIVEMNGHEISVTFKDYDYVDIAEVFFEYNNGVLIMHYSSPSEYLEDSITDSIDLIIQDELKGEHEMNIEKQLEWAKEEGRNHGYDAAYYEDVFEIGASVEKYYSEGYDKDSVEDEADQEELFFACAYDAEHNARQYTPFEFLAKEINDTEYADELWDAYEEGISDGIQARWNELKGADNERQED